MLFNINQDSDCLDNQFTYAHFLMIQKHTNTHLGPQKPMDGWDVSQSKGLWTTTMYSDDKYNRYMSPTYKHTQNCCKLFLCGFSIRNILTHKYDTERHEKIVIKTPKKVFNPIMFSFCVWCQPDHSRH